MTRFIFLLSVLAPGIAVHASSAMAQFELSEPEQPTGSLPREKRDNSAAPTTSSLNRSRKFGNANTAGQSGGIPDAMAAGEDGTEGRILPRGPRVPSFELLSEDAAASNFFSEPVPRTKAIGEDASLNDVCHIGNRCWAVGERGVVCISEDGGLSWVTAVTPTDCSLRSVCFLTNNIGWVAGIRVLPQTHQEAAVLLHTRDGGKTWQDMAAISSRSSSVSTLTTAALPGILHIQFFGLDEAIAVTLPVHNRGGQGIFRSGDGGQSWTAIVSDQAGGPWNAASFISESEGIVVGSYQSYAAVVSNEAVLINAPQPTLRQMRGVSLNQNGEGWIVGDGATVLSTGNAGITWRPPKQEIPQQLAEVVDLHTVAHQGSTVLISGNPGSVVLRSGSGGSDWTLQTMPTSGRIHRLHFLSASEVLAVGSFGHILRSNDAGVTWQAVRSPRLRSGVLNLVTDANRASWQMLANVSGDNGVRSVILQVSQPLSNFGSAPAGSDTAMSERTLFALTQLGGNDTACHWMFPRTRPEHHRSADQLIAEWNRQTDGRLRRLLPLRLARDIRVWKPSIIVIEPGSDDDAIAGILSEVIVTAVTLAEEQEGDSQLLSQIGLQPWEVARVVRRVPADRRATLSFDDADLLPSLGTTAGLLCDAAMRALQDNLQLERDLRPRSGYEIVFDRHAAVAVRNLMTGLEDVLTSDARRPVQRRPRENVESLKAILQAAHLETSALSDQNHAADSADSMIGELQRIGTGLPESLAMKQLKDLATLNLTQNNMESYLAIQQEITRRFPSSEEARNAAEMLFLFYSSAEARHYRIRTMFRPQGLAANNSGKASGAASDGRNPGVVVQPVIELSKVQALSADPGNQLAMLNERWNSHAATALRILLSDQNSDSNRRAVSPLVLMREAANLRSQNKSGEQHNRLAEVSQRDDRFGLFARSEMQDTGNGSIPVLPLFNLPRRSDPPFLDGKLTDAIWEAAEEIPLKPFVRNTASADSAEFTRQKNSGEQSLSSFVMVAWDEEFLYVAARLERPAEKRKSIELATHRSHDATHGDRDRIELEFDTDRDFATSFQLSIDESGQTADRCFLLDKWNPGWFVAVDSDESTWRLEAAIPLAELSAPLAKPGDTWSFRLRRILPGVLQHELVSPGSPVSTDGTGLIRFIRPKVVTKSRQ
jgi:photosystem II stability/assembly factor-like uncharacterized protein